jgi:competence protein ComEA
MKRITKAVAVGLFCGLVGLPLGRGVHAAGGQDAAASRVDINSASVDELARLPGIGPAKAQAIVSHRSADPFRKPEDLRNVKGIGDKLYEQLKDQITVGGPAAGSSDRGG